MFKKRHLVFTALITFVVTIILFNGLALKAAKRLIASDPVFKAKSVIVSDYVDKLSEEKIKEIDDAAIEAMVKELGDPYTRYMGATALEDYNEDNEEEYIGVGMEVVFSSDENVITVISPYDGSPAQKAGVLPGDKIVEVDGMQITSKTYDKVITHIRGEGAEEGSKVIFKVLREGKEGPIELEVIRKQVNIQTITYEMLDRVGYIKIAEFKNRTEEEFEAALETLKDMGAASLIIDLRNNPGGYAHTVISMCDRLLPKGVIAYLEDNEGRREYFRSDAEEISLPMAILINGGTASASELLAGSVQAYGLGIVVGEKSYGKAVGQSPYELSDETALYLTNARYFTPKGECIDTKGIIPDIEVSLSDEKLANLGLLSKEEDDQLQAALEALKK